MIHATSERLPIQHETRTANFGIRETKPAGISSCETGAYIRLSEFVARGGECPPQWKAKRSPRTLSRKAGSRDARKSRKQTTPQKAKTDLPSSTRATCSSQGTCASSFGMQAARIPLNRRARDVQPEPSVLADDPPVSSSAIVPRQADGDFPRVQMGPKPPSPRSSPFRDVPSPRDDTSSA